MEQSFVFSPDISKPEKLLYNLVYSLDWTRNTTIHSVQNLSVEDLDTELIQTMNSIGTLLAHIAAMECHYRLLSFEKRQFNKSESDRWYGAFTGQMQEKNIRGYNVNYYISLLNEQRQLTRACLLQQSDSWLLSESLWQYSKPVNNYYCWFHFMEDEMNHCGQIKAIKSQLLKMIKKSV